ncbi:MAG: hypothetical protein ABIK44_04365 [candidate division WOR-3 bacterium]
MKSALFSVLIVLGLGCQNTPPSVPIVTGPDKARPNDTLSFSALSVDRDGDSVAYLFSWNDNPQSDWSFWYPEAIPYFEKRVFTDTGEYVLLVKARDQKAESDWSDSLWIRIRDYGPLRPKTPAGPDTVAIGDTVGFVTLAYHPLNEQVALQFNWGDTLGEWSRFVQPGSFVWEHHAWLQSGWFEVRARARDSSGHVSEWSGPESVLVVDTFSFRP